MIFSKKILSQFVVTILMLQILNLSIYNNDFYALMLDKNMATQISQENPIDSFAELIVEEFAGIENAFPENGHTDKKSPHVNQNIAFKLIALDFFPKIEQASFFPSLQKQTFPHLEENYFYLFADDISHPPNC